MRLLAKFVMSNRVRAVMSISGLGVLSLLLPPLALLSGGALALVTLRKGLRSGLDVLLLSALAGGALGFLVMGNGVAAAGYLLMQWTPIVALAAWFRFCRSFARTIVAALAAAAIVTVLLGLWTGNSAEMWRSFLLPLEQAFTETQLLEPAAREEVMQFLASWMVGILAAGYLLQSIFTLMLARWWQATLYNPGGFRSEFHQLRLPRPLLGFALAAVAGALLSGGGTVGTLDYLALLFLATGFVQGLAMVHGAVGECKAHIGWLVGMYMLLFIALSQMATLLAATGLADIGLDFRSRLANRRESGDDTG